MNFRLNCAEFEFSTDVYRFSEEAGYAELTIEKRHNSIATVTDNITVIFRTSSGTAKGDVAITDIQLMLAHECYLHA